MSHARAGQRAAARVRGAVSPLGSPFYLCPVRFPVWDRRCCPCAVLAVLDFPFGPGAVSRAPGSVWVDAKCACRRRGSYCCAGVGVVSGSLAGVPKGECV